MSNVFEQLDHEWQRLRDDRGSARRLRDVCDLAGARSLGDLESYVRKAEAHDADRILLALVTRAVGRGPDGSGDGSGSGSGDTLAARVLLQLLLPGTRNLARRWWALGDHDERAAAAVTAVYHRIRTYPLERRPGRIAANVLLDAARELRRSVPRLVTTPSAEPVQGGRRERERADDTSSHAAIELAEVLADAVRDGVLEARDAQLIARSRIAGDRVADIARSGALGTRALWDRRQRAELKLAQSHRDARRTQVA